MLPLFPPSAVHRLPRGQRNPLHSTARLPSVDAVMAAAAFAGLLRGFEDQERRQHAIAQADDGIADFALFVEARNLEIEFAQNSHGAVQTLLAANQADII